MIFDYPLPRFWRRHGPSGYQAYERYRPWLRDEFDFRCVYCLKRETWGQFTGDFELDHFEPQSLNSERRLDYLNLVYACRRCNCVKLDQSVVDPFELLVSTSVAIRTDGSLHGIGIVTQRFIRQLDLNSPRLKKWRRMWMRILDLAEQHNADLYHQLTGFPDDLPDLGQLKPPANDRREGLEQCWFARRRRGELPKSY
jgi:hypothetical protein